MEKTKIYYKKNIKLNKPILLVGLPGIGNVGSLVGEHLKNELKAKRFATLYSPHFMHQTVMLKEGGFRLISNRFYVTTNSEGRSIIILIGDTQAGSPEGQYEVNEKIVRFFKKLGGREIYTIGGYSAGNGYIDHPKVFGVTSEKKARAALAKNGVVIGKAAGTIWGSAGLLLVFGKKNKIPSTCLMGETGMLEIDANAAKSVLEVLMKIIKLNVNLENINKIRKETEKIIKEINDAASGNTDQYQQDRAKLTYIR